MCGMPRSSMSTSTLPLRPARGVPVGSGFAPLVAAGGGSLMTTQLGTAHAARVRSPKEARRDRCRMNPPSDKTDKLLTNTIESAHIGRRVPGGEAEEGKGRVGPAVEAGHIGDINGE